MSRWFRFQVVTLVSAVVLGLTGALASVVLAEDPADEILLRAEASRQQKTAVVEEFIAGLDLSVDQARQVLGVLDDAATVYLETYEQEGGLLAEMSAALAAFSREDSFNQGFSPAVERRTARVNRQAKEVREAGAERLLELEKQAAGLLGEAQLEFATSFKPGKKGRSAVGNRPAKGRKAGARGDRKRAGGHRGGVVRRGMRKDGFNPRIAGGERLVAAREELAVINSRLHPRLSPIGRFLLHPTAVEPLCDITATRPNQNLRDAVDVFEYGTRECPARVYDVGKAEVADLRAEINNWNLINGLHLSGQQIGEIVELYDAAEARIKGRDRPGDGRTRSMQVGRRAKGKRIKPRVVRAAVERAVEQVLNPGQRQVLVDYKACLIPPKNLKNPVSRAIYER